MGGVVTRDGSSVSATHEAGMLISSIVLKRDLVSSTSRDALADTILGTYCSDERWLEGFRFLLLLDRCLAVNAHVR